MKPQPPAPDPTERTSAPSPAPDEQEETGEPVAGEPAIAFPIIGIGASAGGLAAFEQFFANMPPDTGMAFVLVQHLAPDRESILPELVGRYTRMPVAVATDGDLVAPDHVYIIPPNRDMALLHGTLQLIEPALPRGLRLPIDYFFRSLAQDREERAICIVLSGTGTDGTLGVRAVKGEDGLVIVQDPESAQYDGMPRSAIATGLVDYVLRPEAMPERLIGYTRDYFTLGRYRTPTLKRQILDALGKIMVLVRAQTQHDFSRYKHSTTVRRIERRMAINQLASTSDYIRYLQENPLEAHTLFKELLIGVTRFFRDGEAFQALRDQAIAALVEPERPHGEPLRLWVPACSTGEEAYSIAMLVQQRMDELGRSWPVQLFATDIDAEAVATARVGEYPESIAADVPQPLLRQYFKKQGHSYRVIKPVREMLVFAVHSVVKDPPFSNLDLISCRNLLIYLQPDLQRRLLPALHYALKPDGYLFLGTSEGIGDRSDAFATLDRRWRLFQRREIPGGGVRSFGWSVPAPGEAPRPGGKSPLSDKTPSVRELAEQIVLTRLAPACLLVNEGCELLYSHGRAGRYLEPVSGEASLNLLKMAREGLRIPLTSAIRKAVSEQREIRCEGLRVQTETGVQRVDLTVGPVREPPAMRGLLWVAIQELKPEPPETEAGRVQAGDQAAQRIAELEQELVSAKEYLRTSIEEMETSNEELTSTNEELQTSNEELQSTTEELQTSQEELRSVNQELLTVNTELESKMEQLARTNNDLVNLVDTIDIGILFLDINLGIQRFTPAATRVLNLMETDIGRPLAHIGTNLEYRHLERDARLVLDTLRGRECEVRDRDGHWFSLRFQPYYTVEQMVDGVVISFVNIDEQRRGQQLRKLSMAVEHSPGIVYVTDVQGDIQYVNPKFTEVTGYTLAEVAGRNPRVLKSGAHDAAFYRDLWATITAGREWRGEVRNRRKNGELYWASAAIAPVLDDDGRITHYVAVQEETTRRRELEEELRASEALHRLILGSITDAVFITDPNGLFTYVCPNVETIFGRSEEETRALEKIDNLLGGLPYDPRELEARGEITNIEWAIRDGTGARRILLINVKRVEIGVGRVLYTCHEITGRRRTEESLRLSDERYALALRAAGLGSWDWDIPSGRLYWSEAIESLFGLAPGAFAGTYQAFLDCVHPDDRRLVMDTVDACLERGGDYAVEHRVLWPDGSVHRVSERGGVIRDGEGRAVRMLGVVQAVEAQDCG